MTTSYIDPDNKPHNLHFYVKLPIWNILSNNSSSDACKQKISELI